MGQTVRQVCDMQMHVKMQHLLNVDHTMCQQDLILLLVLFGFLQRQTALLTCNKQAHDLQLPLCACISALFESTAAITICHISVYALCVQLSSACCWYRPPAWANELQVKHDQPFYSVLPDEHDCVRLFHGGRTSKYVAQVRSPDNVSNTHILTCTCAQAGHLQHPSSCILLPSFDVNCFPASLLRSSVNLRRRMLRSCRISELCIVLS